MATATTTEMPHPAKADSPEPVSFLAPAVLRARDGTASEQPLGRISVTQYHRMIAAGVWQDEAPELLDGVLLPTMPLPGPLHAFLVHLVASLLRDMLLRNTVPPDCCVRQESAIDLPGSVVGPDIALVRGGITTYRSRNPTAADAVLLIEVSETSQSRDRLKADYYAAAGVASYLIIDIPARTLLLHSEPSGEGYGSVEPVTEVPVVIDGRTIGVLTVDVLFAE